MFLEYMFDPWEHIPPHITVKTTRLHHAAAYTDGNTIWLEETLTHIEERCALTHELLHIALGHTHTQNPKSEHKVRTLTALLLIPHAPIQPWATLTEIAEEHDVTPAVLMDRYNLAQRLSYHRR